MFLFLVPAPTPRVWAEVNITKKKTPAEGVELISQILSRLKKPWKSFLPFMRKDWRQPNSDHTLFDYYTVTWLHEMNGHYE